MQITDILAQMGGLQSMARELGVSDAEAASGAAAQRSRFGATYLSGQSDPDQDSTILEGQLSTSINKSREARRTYRDRSRKALPINILRSIQRSLRREPHALCSARGRFSQLS